MRGGKTTVIGRSSELVTRNLSQGLEQFPHAFAAPIVLPAACLCLQPSFVVACLLVSSLRFLSDFIYLRPYGSKVLTNRNTEYVIVSGLTHAGVRPAFLDQQRIVTLCCFRSATVNLTGKRIVSPRASHVGGRLSGAGTSRVIVFARPIHYVETSCEAFCWGNS